MKKIFVFTWIIILCILQAACGQSTEAKAVDKMIASVDVVTVENKEQILEIEHAYEALSTKDQESLKNLDRLSEIKHQLLKSEFERITNILKNMTDAADRIARISEATCVNVGMTDAASVLKSASFFPNGEVSAEEYPAYLSEATGTSVSQANVNVLLITIARGFNPEDMERGADGSIRFSYANDEGPQKTIKYCAEFCNAKKIIQENIDIVNDLVLQFRDEYGRNNKDLNETLIQWSAGVELYALSALQPSGRLDEFREKMTDLHRTVSLHKKHAEDYLFYE